MKKVAALYVLAKSSHYAALEVDMWPEKRDARRYPGPGPVVAHPPCGPWSAHYGHACTKQDKSLAVAAVLQVRRYGGILEHPRHSRLWDKMSLPRPVRPGPLPVAVGRDSFGGFTLDVDQCWWGHPSKKPTWLYFVGIDPKTVLDRLPPQCPAPPAARIRRLSGRWQSAFDSASPETRKRTPAALAAWLVEIAKEALPPGRGWVSG